MKTPNRFEGFWWVFFPRVQLLGVNCHPIRPAHKGNSNLLTIAVKHALLNMNIQLSLYIYIYICREREGEREREIWLQGNSTWRRDLLRNKSTLSRFGSNEPSSGLGRMLFSDVKTSIVDLTSLNIILLCLDEYPLEQYSVDFNKSLLQFRLPCYQFFLYIAGYYSIIYIYIYIAGEVVQYFPLALEVKV